MIQLCCTMLNEMVNRILRLHTSSLDICRTRFVILLNGVELYTCRLVFPEFACVEHSFTRDNWWNVELCWIKVLMKVKLRSLPFCRVAKDVKRVEFTNVERIWMETRWWPRPLNFNMDKYENTSLSYAIVFWNTIIIPDKRFCVAFQVNDVIVLLERVNEEWFRGEIDNRVGRFPTAFVKILTPLPWDSF